MRLKGFAFKSIPETQAIPDFLRFGAKHKNRAKNAKSAGKSAKNAPKYPFSGQIQKVSRRSRCAPLRAARRVFARVFKAFRYLNGLASGGLRPHLLLKPSIVGFHANDRW